MSEKLEIPGTYYLVSSDLKIINKNTGKEIKCCNVSVLMEDGVRHTIKRSRLIYAAKNRINPLSIPKGIIIDKSGEGIDRYEFYKKRKRGSVLCRYPVDIKEYRKLIECLEKGTPPTFMFDYLKEIESYCKHQLQRSDEEAYELAVNAISLTIDNATNGIFPYSIIGYINGTARKMLAAKRLYNKTFLNPLDKQYE